MIPRMFYNIREAKEIMNISQSQLYNHLKAGKIKAKKDGNKTLIPHQEIEKWAEGLSDWEGNKGQI